MKKMKDVYTFKAPEEIARIIDILDRTGITADDLETIFPELPPRHGEFTQQMSFRATYEEIQKGLQNLMDRMIELGALYLRDTNG